MSNDLNIEILESSFGLLADQADALVNRFYERLFEKYPQVKPMFANADMTEQKKKLLGSLKLVISNLRNPEVLVDALHKLGRRHQGYGAVEAHYPAVEENLLSVMQEFAGDAWTDEIHDAWSQALSQVSEIMLQGYDEKLEVGKMNDESNVEELKQELQKLKGAVDGAQTAMIMVDRDLVITYANNKTLNMMKEHEATFKSIWPSFDAGNMIGQGIDQFHKNPSHQRNLLADPRNLPYKTDIEVGPLKFALTVSAQIDSAGNYVGNTLEWEDVTDQRKKETEVVRLQSAVDGAEANLMLCDADLNITYANPAVVEMLRVRQSELRQTWPSLDVDNMIGQNIDQFHKNPSHQRALLGDASKLPATAEISVGDLEFKVNATMIKGPNGEYLGNMVQWSDITDQKKAENEIQGLIQGASQGELDRRIENLDQFEGFIRNLGEGINSLMDSVVKPVKEGMRIIQALAEGDLTQKMELGL